MSSTDYYKIVLDSIGTGNIRTIIEALTHKLVDVHNHWSFVEVLYIVNGENVKLRIYYRNNMNIRTGDNLDNTSASVKIINEFDTNESFTNWSNSVDRYGLEGITKAVISTSDQIHTWKSCPDCVILNYKKIQESFQQLAEIIYYKKNAKSNSQRIGDISYSNYLIKIALFNFPREIWNEIALNYTGRYLNDQNDPYFFIANYLVNGKFVKVQIWKQEYSVTKRQEYGGVNAYAVWYTNNFDRTLQSIARGVNEGTPGFIVTRGVYIDEKKYPDYFVEKQFDAGKTIDYISFAAYDFAMKEFAEEKAYSSSAASSSASSSSAVPKLTMSRNRPANISEASEKIVTDRQAILYVSLVKHNRFQPITIEKGTEFNTISDFINIIALFIHAKPEDITLTIYHGKSIGGSLRPVVSDFTLESGQNIDINTFSLDGGFPAFSVIY